MGVHMVYFAVLLVTLLHGSQQTTATKYVPKHKSSFFPSGGPHVSPFTVAIFRDNDFHQRCTGVLISDRFVLTAAQCVDCERAEVVLGAFDILVKERTQVRQYITEKDIIPHPYFDPRTTDHDLAIVKLPKKVKLNAFVNVVKLADQDLVIGYGTTVNLIGWERRQTGYSNTLSQASLRLISNDKCHTYWPRVRIDAHKLCASNTRHDSQIPGWVEADCIIDSGSPLTLPGKPDTLLGLLTGSSKCGSYRPDIFVDVASYQEWIQSVVESEEATTVAVNVEQTTQVSVSLQPVTTAATTPQPVTTAATTPQPVTTVATTPQPVTTVSSTSQPVTTVASTPQSVTTIASTPQTVTTVASIPQHVTTVATTPQRATPVASTPQPVTTVSSTSQPVTTVASTPQSVTTIASTPQTVTTVASTPQHVSTVASTPQSITTIASTPEPVSTVASTKEPVTVIVSTTQPVPGYGEAAPTTATVDDGHY